MNGEEGFHFLFLEFSVGETLGVGRLLDLCSLSTGEGSTFTRGEFVVFETGIKGGRFGF